eukprot:CAMPEP_0177682788 /NCGR_PEP_ID=MMETSP0447-20121125/31439_1 /TAXON_ID=0 /ORGANISM="Stygamoeba regulata, Strain BSH-02190019" /LENGTH=161 /DNA_ID=CAMNT_0019192301 /DNA_START=133 /DNA_END=618 /DNA_ORIENTATION=-
MSDEKKSCHSCPLANWKYVNYATAGVLGATGLALVLAPEETISFFGNVENPGSLAKSALRASGVMCVGMAAHHIATASETNDASQQRFAAAASFALASSTASDIYSTFVAGDMEATPALYAGIGLGVTFAGLFAARAFVCPNGCATGGCCPFSSETPVSDE